ncbi:hypothetical protein EJ06DRAFT_529843 [Trichodelitschia bisporula]|uniref:Uncharacterized protein n=1 Tax=Trichodelitschia bisporula TaxID=703511 RepID=A0A6G1HXJ4_9PEZI|nr:hypothetical protein EJ06DRAFT_529843 [Trichodelitschia bisporula]
MSKDTTPSSMSALHILPPPTYGFCFASFVTSIEVGFTAYSVRAVRIELTIAK